MVRRLEAALDSEEVGSTGLDVDVPSGDEIAAELEQFLRGEGHRGPDATDVETSTRVVAADQVVGVDAKHIPATPPPRPPPFASNTQGLPGDGRYGAGVAEPGRPGSPGTGGRAGPAGRGEDRAAR